MNSSRSLLLALAFLLCTSFSDLFFTLPAEKGKELTRESGRSSRASKRLKRGRKKMLNIKLKHEKLGDHIHTTVFARWTDGADTTFQNLGKLVTDVGQHQLIWAALRIGQEKMQGHLTVQHEGWSPKNDRTTS